ncbi:MAG: FOG: TPR repeat [uncultured Caballeronia sp.]|nr:MAG: FOG: TPR repeat [uncultured Caballeronia sp.]
MKPSSGRASSVAKLAAAALATVTFGLGATFLTATPALAQVSTATADDTPAIDLAISQKQWPSALAQLDARLKTNPRDVQAKFKRATVLARLNRDDEAIAAFTELTQASPELPEPYNNLAALYAKKGRYDEARVALETATKANPSYALAYENLGDLYLRLASESYKRAQTLGSKSPLTAQRVGDIQKIVSPPPRAHPEAAAASGASHVPAASAATAASSSSATSNDWTGTTSTNDMSSSLYSPFAGPSVPLSTTPYFAPTNP